MIRLLLFISLLCTSLLSNDKTLALEILNNIRTNAGLNTLKHNQILENASQSHANYLKDTIIEYKVFQGHYENNTSYSSSFYTGNTPGDRGLFAGYKALYYSENLSAGQKDINSSVDGLMSAIYHRFGFLSFEIDEIGVGINKEISNNFIYNYNMGISSLNTLCSNTSSFEGIGSYYTGVCADKTLKVESQTYLNALTSVSKNNPKYTYWPNSNEIFTPVFYEESPDPLPDMSVSGNPISIEFNDDFYKSVTINSFRLYKENGDEVTDTRLVDKSNDVNTKFSGFQFALFPLKRLDWDSKYKAEIDYVATLENNSSESKTFSWQFRTKATQYPYITSKEKTETLNVVSGKKYNIYFEPIDGNDELGQIYIQGFGKVVNFDFLDKNTISLEITGDVGKSMNIYSKTVIQDGVVQSFDRNITITFASSDNAVNPKDWSGVVLDDKFAYLKSLDNGWHLLGAVEDIPLSELSQFKVVWVYVSGKWQVYSKILDLSSYNYETFSKIDKSKGFWVLKE